jgi:hypothetical protein
MAVLTAKVVTETPRSGQGDTDANPIPEPKVIRISVADTETNAPAMMEGHDAADLAGEEEGSAVMTAGPGVIICSTICPSAV